jgi:glucose-6-phosphate isomerase
VNINAYHQPGVEAGKKMAASILELQKAIVQVLQSSGEPLDLAILAEKAGFPDEVEAVYKIVRHLDANKRGLVIKGDRANPASLKVSAG